MPSESDLDSQSASDSESVHSASKPQCVATSQHPGSQDTLDALNTTLTNGKRKAELENDGPAAKIRRTDASDTESDESDDDDDIPADGGYVQHSFFADEEPLSNEAPPTALPSQTSDAQSRSPVLHLMAELVTHASRSRPCRVQEDVPAVRGAASTTRQPVHVPWLATSPTDPPRDAPLQQFETAKRRRLFHASNRRHGSHGRGLRSLLQEHRRLPTQLRRRARSRSP